MLLQKHYLSWKNNGGVLQTSDINKNQPVDINGNTNATGQSSTNNSTVNNAAVTTQASAPQTMAGICAGNASAWNNEQESSLARTSVESSLANIPTNNNNANANASTRNYKVAFEMTTTNEMVSKNTDNVSQTEESNLNSTRLFPSNLTGELATLLQTQNFDDNIRSLLNILINSINSTNARVG